MAPLPPRRSTGGGMRRAPARVHVRQEARRARLRPPADGPLQAVPRPSALARIQLPVAERTAVRAVRLRGMSPTDVVQSQRLVGPRAGGERLFPPVRLVEVQPVQEHVLQFELLRSGLEDAVHGAQGPAAEPGGMERTGRRNAAQAVDFLGDELRWGVGGGRRRSERGKSGQRRVDGQPGVLGVGERTAGHAAGLHRGISVGWPAVQRLRGVGGPGQCRGG
mmetsp:Transcript_14166/g.29133  ORF Transcript_14166/g.29133 Transcript_14166/m.29133 type:complete len:221 (+) Transcript_14166:101-763(+)